MKPFVILILLFGVISFGCIQTTNTHFSSDDVDVALVYGCSASNTYCFKEALSDFAKIKVEYGCFSLKECREEHAPFIRYEKYLTSNGIKNVPKGMVWQDGKYVRINENYE